MREEREEGERGDVGTSANDEFPLSLGVHPPELSQSSFCILTSTVEDHATGPGRIVLLDALLLDGLLGDDITGAKEHSRCDHLGEQRPAVELGLVPVNGEFSIDWPLKQEFGLISLTI